MVHTAALDLDTVGLVSQLATTAALAAGAFMLLSQQDMAPEQVRPALPRGARVRGRQRGGAGQHYSSPSFSRCVCVFCVFEGPEAPSTTAPRAARPSPAAELALGAPPGIALA